MLQAYVLIQGFLDKQSAEHPHIMVLSHVWPRDMHKDAIRGHNALKLDRVALFLATVEDFLVECWMGNLANCSIDESENSLSDLGLFSTVFKNCLCIFLQLVNYQSALIPMQKWMQLCIDHLIHLIDNS